MNTSSPSPCYVGPCENEKHVRKFISVVPSRRSIMRFKKIHCLVWAIGCWYLSTVSSFILPVRRSKVAFPQCQSDLRPYRTTFLIRDTCYFQNQCKKAIRTRQFPAVYSVGDDFVEAEDLEALQSLFRKYCDSDGLMTSQSVQNVPSIAQLLVSVCVANRSTILLHACVNDESTCSRITPRQCRTRRSIRRRRI